VAVAEDFAASVEGELWPQEAAFIEKAVEGRRAEFTAGRVLARRAIAMLGGGDCAIPPGSRNMPVWPEGFAGSISHAQGHVVAAVARKSDLLSLGIDFEDASRFRQELERKIAAPDEIALNFEGLPPDTRQMALAIMFSAKEAFYKCQYPVTGQYLGFHDAWVAIDFDERTFGLKLLAEAPALASRDFIGRYSLQDKTVFTAMVME
jgi:4'-phosphopantetheinyl transferase EntD